MADMETVGRAGKIIDRLTEILWPFVSSTGVMFQEGKIITHWEGRGPEVEIRRKRGPGLLETIYREIPLGTRRKFLAPTKEPTPKPTDVEWVVLERLLLGTARRVINREIRKRLKILPRVPGRDKRQREKARLICQTVRKHQKQGATVTQAVSRTVDELRKEPGMRISVPTVWRHLARARRGRTRLPARR